MDKTIRTGVVLAAIGLVSLTAGGIVTLVTVDDRDAAITGRVTGPQGAAVADARVEGPDGASTRTDRDGRFRLEGGPGWLTVSAPGWLPRSRVGVPGEETLVRVAPSTPDTITLAFGGDVMFGRRYFDPDEDGSIDGLLTPYATPADHERLLTSVAPLLRDADLATVNLETPLIDEPHFDPTLPRPDRFHPTKDFAFASAPAAAEALHDLGVDVVGLANNHLYDALADGVTSTQDALTVAGFAPGEGFYGAGVDDTSAWAPAFREVRGVRVAFLGCTSILGEEHAISYVAGPGKGGAAACDPARLQAAVRAADLMADVVIVSIHGGFEYGREPSAQVRQLSDLAVASGATLVVNHHPHVVGGLRFAGGRLTAWTLGNLLFDQTVWPTFESYVLQVAVRGGEVVTAWVEPVRIQEYRPTGVYGDDADWVVRGAQVRSEGPWITDNGSLWLDTSGAARQATTASGGGLERIDTGCAPGAGREVLWTGGFEPGDLSGRSGALWNARDASPYRKVDPDAARHGQRGVLLHRGSANTSAVVLTIDHRVLVDPGDQLTLLVSTRARYGSPDAELRLSWYNDTRGASQAHTVVPLPAEGGWRTTQVDVTVPINAVAVQPFIGLSAPEKGVTQLAVDDVALVDWSQPGCDYLRGAAVVTHTAIPPLSPDPTLTPIDADLVSATTPHRIPPGPPKVG